jgi:hypothetical protein
MDKNIQEYLEQAVACLGTLQWLRSKTAAGANLELLADNMHRVDSPEDLADLIDYALNMKHDHFSKKVEEYDR